MRTKKPTAFQNAGKDLLPVLHSTLKRFSNESAYKSICPACKQGVLLIRRNDKTFTLERMDICTFCVQFIWYRDKKINGEPLQGRIADARNMKTAMTLRLPKSPKESR